MRGDASDQADDQYNSVVPHNTSRSRAKQGRDWGTACLVSAAHDSNEGRAEKHFAYAQPSSLGCCATPGQDKNNIAITIITIKATAERERERERTLFMSLGEGLTVEHAEAVHRAR
jgi:hypothetical protein